MDNKLQWAVKAASAYTQGGKTPAAIYAAVATRQGDINQPGLSESESLTVDVDGLALPCYTFPADGEHGLDGRARSARLAAKALAELWNRHGPLPPTTAMVCSVNQQDWGSDPAEAIQDQLVNNFFELGDPALVDWCSLCSVYRMDEPKDRALIETETSLVWLSADSLVNQATVDRLSDRVAIKHFPDGLVLGEAATAIWLTTDPSPGSARLALYPEPLIELTGSNPKLADIQPYSHGLVTHLDQDLDQQAHWHQWLGDFEPKTEFDTLQCASITLGFGYVGTAGPGLAVLCALGRQQMPCPPVATQWLFHQTLDQRYSLLKLDSSPNTATPAIQPKQGGLSG
ncbi:MAG: hypothetical protein WD601_07610 [Pseudohongiellaceae bacterium]